MYNKITLKAKTICKKTKTQPTREIIIMSKQQQKIEKIECILQFRS